MSCFFLFNWLVPLVIMYMGSLVGLIARNSLYSEVVRIRELWNRVDHMSALNRNMSNKCQTVNNNPKLSISRPRELTVPEGRVVEGKAS